MKMMTTSVYTFSNLIDGNFLYVDKTADIYRLIQPASAQYFLSRPRRFGKSLLISTLKAIFQGRRELFDGLFIASTDYDWVPYPVIHLDMGSCVADSTAGIETALIYMLNQQAKGNGVSLTQEDASGRFLELVERLAERDGKVVILVDEYDKPLLGKLGSPDVREFQSLLKTFYGVIKTTESAQRFALITGVSKFTKVSIFSDLNNLTDLTMDAGTATLLGYTQEELEANFPDYIERLAGTIGRTKAETLEVLRTWYNGYRFHQRAETVYNPVSVMKCLGTQDVKNFWFETGTPTFLVDLLRKQSFNPDNLVAIESDFSSYEPDQLPVLPLLVQTGYLTIKGTEGTLGDTTYLLGYPNREIETSFNRCLAQGFTQLAPEDLTGALYRLVGALRENHIEDMLEHLKFFFSKVPNTIAINNEKYYQTIFYTVFKLIGAAIEAEVSTNIGRIDAVLKTKADIFVFEFKLNGTADEAMAQIHDKRYYEIYLDDGRQITLVGVEFSAKDRNLGEHRIEILKNGQVREESAAYEVDDLQWPLAPGADMQAVAHKMKARGFPAAIIKDVTGITVVI